MRAMNSHLDLPSLTHQRAVVTGASDGIGLRIATRLAEAGADIVLPVRNSAKGEAAMDTIRAAVPAARVRTEQLDLSELASVASFGAMMRDRGEPIHLLINNAGVMTPPARQSTGDGFEVQLGTNHLGHVALIAQLFPLLRAGRARITSQVSVAASRGTIAWDDLNSTRSYDGMRAYRQSKIALGLFALELDRRSARGGWGITSNLSHPGVAPTSLLSARPELGRATDTPEVRMIRWASARGLVVGTPETAALPALLAATSGRGGLLFGPRGLGHLGGMPAEQRLYRPLRSVTDAERIWEVSEGLIGTPLPS
ncbi:SDR family oxidoreductase [Microbacterium sp. GXS0129]|uniref:SDR family oxidoreductase n=1 Tax=Microbacterium sp. GXS0129 TaxID=3377836 RepID=UPI00383A6C37